MDHACHAGDAPFKRSGEGERLARLHQGASIDEVQALEQMDRVLSVEREVQRAQVGVLVRRKNALRATMEPFVSGRRRRRPIAPRGPGAMRAELRGSHVRRRAPVVLHPSGCRGRWTAGALDRALYYHALVNSRFVMQRLTR